ncbi:MAG: Gfo/Idh/MocA family oxidoreductase [Treponema sp.]|jgi:predicted dehydrogenase|nr:Gfo/Idh/MocA family oxidoreductase [Treponema sp.]
MDTIRVGVVGVGMISDIFIENMINTFTSLEVAGCTARNMEHIKAKAEKYNITPMTIDEMIGDNTINMIVNLTPPDVHYEIIKRSLESGKHVYTEKPLALGYGQAKELLNLAESRDLLLGCSPDTFLGSGVQTAIEAVNSGMIGDVTGFTVMLNRGLDFLYEYIGFIIKPGGGIGYDFGVYALTALFSILGPAEEVCGFMQTNRPFREYKNPMMPKYGQQYKIENENLIAAAIKMRNNVIGTVMFNGDSVFPEKPYISLQGTQGMLYLPDPNGFGGDCVYVPAMSESDRILPVHHKYSKDSRGIGAADMALAIREGRAHRASGAMACHLLELLDGIANSCETKTYTTMASDFIKPAPLTGKEVF